MSIEVSVFLISMGFLALIGFLFFVLSDLRKTLKKTNHFLTETQKDIHRVSDEGCDLLEKVNTVAEHLQNVSRGIDTLFKPFQHEKKHKDTVEKIPEILEALAKAVYAVNHVKEGIKRYVKSR